eukprot:CAMPEP_0174831244 /NCGR_PEP_ID=MMETSP1114-20130205/2987_1 /TAXON_ID=312471 /ORGANISM="Neobodo designis, Strain CCAP 1951/1" /LENGTH=427 /DNA_ID=CAMNT_0016065065 /DNA_START=40 /DNA_END=1323 /DNA_ORIENTATION=+
MDQVIEALRAGSPDAAALFATATRGCSNADLTAASGVTSLPNDFGKDHSTLQEVKLPPSITTVGDGCFAGAAALRQLDVGHLRSLTTIGSDFCANAKKLKGPVALPASVTSIGSGFCRNTRALRGADFSRATGLTALPDDCLRGSGVAAVALPPNVHSIGDRFASGADQLERLEIAHLSCLQRVGAHFCSHTDSLRGELAFPPGVSVFGPDLLACTPLVTNVDLSRCDKLESIPDRAFFSSNVTRIALPASSLRSIGGYFAADATMLEHLDLSELSALREIGDQFCAGAMRLQGDMALPPSVVSVGDWFMRNTPLVRKVDMSAATELTALPDHVLFASGVEVVELPPKVEAIGDHFAAHARSLSRCDVSQLNSLREIGASFCANASLANRLDAASVPDTVANIGDNFARPPVAVASPPTPAVTSAAT